MQRELVSLKKRIGTRVRERRNQLDISQEDLAFDAEISPTYLSQIEGGKRNTTIDTLYRICTVLKMELSDLVKS